MMVDPNFSDEIAIESTLPEDFSNGGTLNQGSFSTTKSWNPKLVNHATWKVVG